MDGQKISVVIVDDHIMIIEGLKALLSDIDNISIVAQFTTGKDTLDYLANHTVDVILQDVNLPDINGVQLSKTIAGMYPDVKILGISNFNEPSIIRGMVQSGVKGYLLKNATTEELTFAIQQISRGQYYFSAEAQKVLADSVTHQVDNQPKLTRREKVILQLIADGKTTNQIAAELFISPLTVETHRRNLMKKLNVANAAAMVKWAIDNKMLD